MAKSKEVDRTCTSKRKPSDDETIQPKSKRRKTDGATVRESKTGQRSAARRGKGRAAGRGSHSGRTTKKQTTNEGAGPLSADSKNAQKTQMVNPKEKTETKRSTVNRERTKIKTEPQEIEADGVEMEREQPKIKQEAVSSQVSEKKSIKQESMTRPGVSGQYSAKERKYVGAHTSIAGSLSNAVLEAVELGARAIGMFLKSQRQWKSKPLDDKVAEEFKETCQKHDFRPEFILPHGSYLMNCASPKEETLSKSRDMLVDELQRCEKLGLTLFNFHPGSTCGQISTEEGVKRIAKSINQAHRKTATVITVLENMCCQGHTLGGKFEDLAAIIDLVDDKSRVGVCLDTCHALAAGFDLTTEQGYEDMVRHLDEVIGLSYLKAVHVNDSKGGVGCHLDRHETIGRGKIGLDGFRRLMNDPRFDDIPMVLETPEGDYKREIRSLYRLCES